MSNALNFKLFDVNMLASNMRVICYFGGGVLGIGESNVVSILFFRC